MTDGEVLQIGSMTTDVLRGMMREWRQNKPISGAVGLNALNGFGGDVLRDLTQEAVLWLTTPSRPVEIGGRSLKDLAGDQLDSFGDRVVAAAEDWCTAADYNGADHGLVTAAVIGASRCRGWWGTPSWRSYVDMFLNALTDYRDPFWGPNGEHWPTTTPPPKVSDRALLRAMLLVSPWDLDSEAAEWVAAAGINYMTHPWRSL